jgi:predicted enzyme related to lactoylglutathione lyase
MGQGFLWYELMTTDLEAATDFYRGVVGWTAADAGGANAGYTIFSAEGRGVAGAMAIPDEARARGKGPGWMGYIAIDDTDAAAERIASAGGSIHRPPADIPEVGRFAVVADPGGAPFMLLTPTPRGDAPPSAPRMTPGHVGWHELYAADGDAAFLFYAEQFGWSEVSTMDMGPMGTYRIWSAGGDEGVGGMMTKPPQAPQPVWLFYFVVDSVEAAAARIAERGGSVRMGPMEVPDGSWVVQAFDPQGGMFALVSKNR